MYAPIKPAPLMLLAFSLLPIHLSHAQPAEDGIDGPGALVLEKESKLYKFLHEDLYEDYKGALEASGITHMDGHFYVVFDNIKMVAKIDGTLNQDPGDLFVNDEMPFDHIEGFEGVTHDGNGTLFMIAEHIGEDREGLVVSLKTPFARAAGHKLKFKGAELKKKNKGFEGITYLERGGEEYLLALCEGNRCEKDDSGEKGILKVFKRDGKKWKYDKEVAILDLGFEDYAGIDVLNNKEVAIVSQQSSRLWVGVLNEQWELVQKAVYDLPRQREIGCDGGQYLLSKPELSASEQITYGNIEGVAWISNGKIAVVSDRRKKDDQQLWHSCKDQSIHIFKLPQ